VTRRSSHRSNKNAETMPLDMMPEVPGTTGLSVPRQMWIIHPTDVDVVHGISGKGVPTGEKGGGVLWEGKELPARGMKGHGCVRITTQLDLSF
jgi:hypothetical protein